jgi:putative acetyltransferase
MKICQAVAPQQITLCRALFEEYAAWLGINLSFQNFSAELASLPGIYAPSGGRLLHALEGNTALGCVALRPLEADVCEMKRLFVRPEFRGQSLGRQLAENIDKEAHAIGYAKIRLDTLPSMQAAIRLYEALGFVRCGAYYETPLADTIFMELQL